MVARRGDWVRFDSIELLKDDEIPQEWVNLSKAEKQELLVIIRRILHAKEP